MDKLLILGAGSFQLPLIRKAVEMGVYVIVITPDGDYPGIKVADKVYFHDAKDEEYALEIAKNENIDGIISDQGEIFVRPIAYVAEKMGLPGNGYETALIYTNKYRMRKKSRELGLPTIESIKVKTLEDALQAF
ncbi:MAG: carboxylate--amine ligase, partial [Clostridiales bacterium]|nr:carboxylate--amine ligase [Clostridiales bacterium]